MKPLVFAVACLASTTAVAAPRTVAVSCFDNNTDETLAVPFNPEPGGT